MVTAAQICEYAKEKKKEACSLNCRLCSDKTPLKIISVWEIQNNYVNEAGTSYSILFKVNVGQLNYCKFLQYPLAETSSHGLMSLLKWMVKKVGSSIYPLLILDSLPLIIVSFFFSFNMNLLSDI